MGRLRGCLWLTAGLVVAALAGAVAFLTLNSIDDQQTGGGLAGPSMEVVVASRAIEVRSVLSTDDLELRQVPVDAAPESAITELTSVTGMITLVDLYPGEIILAQRLVDPNVTTGDGRLALVIAEDQVLMAYPAGDLMNRIGVLKPGDHVDLYFSLDVPVQRGTQPIVTEGETGEAERGVVTEEEKQVTFSLLENVAIAAIVAEPTATGGADSLPEAILFTIDPQDALLLKYAKDADGIIDIVLRAPGIERPYDTEPVDMGYMINRYRIPAGSDR